MTKNIYIKVNGHKMKGTLFYPSNIKLKNPAILFIHGWTSNETGYVPRAKALSKLGFICLTFNLRGHDGNQKNIGQFSRNDHLQDCIDAYDFLCSQKKVDNTKIGVVGASYGGYLGTILSGKRKVSWLALRAPALFNNNNINLPTKQLIDNREGSFFQKMKPEKDNIALLGVKVFNGGLLIVESEKDQIIPHGIIKYFKNASSDKKKISHQIIKQAGHELSTKKYNDSFINILTEWFKEKINFKS